MNQCANEPLPNHRLVRAQVCYDRNILAHGLGGRMATRRDGEGEKKRKTGANQAVDSCTARRESVCRVPFPIPAATERRPDCSSLEPEAVQPEPPFALVLRAAKNSSTPAPHPSLQPIKNPGASSEAFQKIVGAALRRDSAKASRDKPAPTSNQAGASSGVLDPKPIKKPPRNESRRL